MNGLFTLQIFSCYSQLANEILDNCGFCCWDREVRFNLIYLGSMYSAENANWCFFQIRAFVREKSTRGQNKDRGCSLQFREDLLQISFKERSLLEY